MVESAVGAHLLAKHLGHSSTSPSIHYWRDGVNEVDFVLRDQSELFALEIKNGHKERQATGLDAFCKQFSNGRPQVIGTGGIALEKWFLM